MCLSHKNELFFIIHVQKREKVSLKKRNSLKKKKKLA